MNDDVTRLLGCGILLPRGLYFVGVEGTKPADADLEPEADGRCCVIAEARSLGGDEGVTVCPEAEESTGDIGESYARLVTASRKSGSREPRSNVVLYSPRLADEEQSSFGLTTLARELLIREVSSSLGGTAENECVVGEGEGEGEVEPACASTLKSISCLPSSR